VNAAAMEEFQEAHQRQDFLKRAAQQDLIDSIRDTEKAIQEIDQVSRQKFAEAFGPSTPISGWFSRPCLAAAPARCGSRTRRILAESGIDIVCSPPGKRPAERAPAFRRRRKPWRGLPLLMAIFRYQPSPVLCAGRVDAPLDEANIGRPHAPAPGMSEQNAVRGNHPLQADHGGATALYGVTMQEPGVSRLVSVRFNAEAAALGARPAKGAACGRLHTAIPHEVDFEYQSTSLKR